MNLKKGWKNVGTDPEKSIEFFKKAQEVENTSDVAEGLAYAYNNNKQYDKAIPEALKIFKLKKDFKSANLVVDASNNCKSCFHQSPGRAQIPFGAQFRSMKAERYQTPLHGQPAACSCTPGCYRNSLL